MKQRTLSAALVAALVGLVLCGTARTGAAQAAKPMATVSFSGFDALVADFEAIGQIAGNPGLAQMVQGPMLMATQGQGPAAVGIDPKRPWVLVITPYPATVANGYVFLPVSDLNKLFAAWKPMGITPEDVGNGVYRVSGPGGHNVFLKQHGEWTVGSIVQELLADVPADPSSLLPAAAKQYTLVGQLNLANVPPGLKQMLMMGMEMGAQKSLQRKPNETAEEYSARAALARKRLDETKVMLNDMEAVTIGLAVDKSNESICLDMDTTAAAGSKTAAAFALVTPGKSRFTGFAAPEAAMTFVTTRRISEREITDALDTLQGGRAGLLDGLSDPEIAEADAARAKQFLDDAYAVFEETLKAGQIDAGAAAFLTPGGATITGGMGLVDGAKFDKLLRELAGTASAESPELAALIKLDADRLDDVALHTFSVPVPEGIEFRDQIVQLFGETVEVVVGTDAKSAYVAVGRGAMDQLKSAINRSKAEADREVPPLKVTLAVAPLAQALATMAPSAEMRQQAAMLAMLFGQAGSDARITVTLSAVPNGTRTRLEIEKGILKAIGQMASQMGPPGR